MSHEKRVTGSDVLLVKIRPGSGLRAAASRIDLEPLHERAADSSSAFGLDREPRWFLARLAEDEASPWDQAHARIASQLGIDASDVLFAEPDLVHQVFVEDPDGGEGDAAGAFALGENCTPEEQDDARGKVARPGDFAWHLGSSFSQLRDARAEVQFTDPRTRIAHLDTGYFPDHETRPRHLTERLEKNFVGRDGNPSSASDPDNNRLLFDNSGHGTGTLSILAGGPVSAHGDQVMGGAPDADVVPLRVADSVVLLRTSALARAIRYASDIGAEVATLSMGGVPTRAWGEAVDAAYEAGLCLCAAAGNHVAKIPPNKLVYPARYPRVIAVCGVMADGSPYADLKGRALEGSFGPKKAMEFALAAYTPNIPWAKFGCADAVRLNGEGTSSATPQVAAAAALWIEHYKELLPRTWRRVEAVRHALFSTAKLRSDKKHFGNGVLQAHAALAVRPRLDLPQSSRSDSSFAFLRVVTGIGLHGTTAREEMFNVELAQRWLLNPRLQEIVADPEGTAELSQAKLRSFMEAVIEDDGASRALRRHIKARYPMAAGRATPKKMESLAFDPDPPPAGLGEPQIPVPSYRRIRVYGTDPSLSHRLDTAKVNEVTLKVRWESLTAGPKGEYLHVDDKGPSNYRGVDLDDRSLLAQDGWAPSEGNPQFHQQMVYAVAMSTIEHFEQALGRVVLWRHRPVPGKPFKDGDFVQQLVVRPHALQQANAYYSPQEVALLFGYFEAGGGSRGPRRPVYTCLSHDIIAHETTHAILDGMYSRFNEPTNLDVLAFHEAFADIVALLQHFTMPELLEHQIAGTRGDLEAESLLGKLAVQFGEAAGGATDASAGTGRGSLRSAIGTVVDGQWKRFEPNPEDLERRQTPHSRGAVLVAAVFDALIAIYKQRIADLLRIATGGTGVLPNGAIHPDLVGRLAQEAAKSARHVLTMCIRALDYLPPVDVTFFDFLRALVTADFELVADDRHGYRVAFVEAFSRRGIFPGDHDERGRDGVPALSADTLRWQGFKDIKFPPKVGSEVLKRYKAIVKLLKSYADTCLYMDSRELLFKETRKQRAILHTQLEKAFQAVPEFAASLGLRPGKFEVHALRRAMRVRFDGRAAPQVFVALTQMVTVPENEQTGTPGYIFRGGSTLVVDLAAPDVPKYRIVKEIDSKPRQEAAEKFQRGILEDPLRKLFFSADSKEPFAALHALSDAEP